MKWLRTILLSGFAIGIAAAAVPALAQAGKQTQGVIEKVDASEQRVVIQETHGRKGLMPLVVAEDAKIVTPAGPASLAALHVGDEVTVHFGGGPRGQQATEIEVTKSAPAK
jgi:hypothetical protein